MMFASFYSKGTTPSFNDKLNTLTSGTLICSTVSISSLLVRYFSNSFSNSVNGKTIYISE